MTNSRVLSRDLRYDSSIEQDNYRDLFHISIKLWNAIIFQSRQKVYEAI